jgi:hypothetical protein
MHWAFNEYGYKSDGFSRSHGKCRPETTCLGNKQKISNKGFSCTQVTIHFKVHMWNQNQAQAQPMCPLSIQCIQYLKLPFTPIEAITYFSYKLATESCQFHKSNNPQFEIKRRIWSAVKESIKSHQKSK